MIYTAAPVFLPGSFDPLPTRLDVVPGDAEVTVPAPRRLRSPQLRMRHRRDDWGNLDDSEVERLARFVERTAVGNRNSALYWAARRVAEDRNDTEWAAALLEAAAVRAGQSAVEAMATIKSGLRHG